MCHLNTRPGAASTRLTLHHIACYEEASGKVRMDNTLFLLRSRRSHLRAGVPRCASAPKGSAGALFGRVACARRDLRTRLRFHGERQRPQPRRGSHEHRNKIESPCRCGTSMGRAARPSATSVRPCRPQSHASTLTRNALSSAVETTNAPHAAERYWRHRWRSAVAKPMWT